MSSGPEPQRPRPPAPDNDWALFLDVDGCLLDFADAPDAVSVTPALRDCLAALSAHLHGALALVSGRSLDTLDRLFAPLQLPSAGLHGLERRNGAGLVDSPLPASLLRIARVQAKQIGDARDVITMERVYKLDEVLWRGPGAYR